MSQTVIIPYVPSGNARRSENVVAVDQHLRQHGFGPLIAWANPFSPGVARNQCLASRWSPKEPMLIFNDADSICPPGQIHAAIRLATAQPGLVFAYDLYCRWTQQATEQWCVSGDPWNELGKPIPSLAFDGKPIFNSGSMACVAISRACFEEVGGFDESYVGWGYEDLDFAERCNALWPNRRVSGPVYHLWHGERNPDDSPADSDPDQVKENQKRFLDNHETRLVETWQR